MMGLSYAQLDVSTEEMENVDLYMQSLSVPARHGHILSVETACK